MASWIDYFNNPHGHFLKKTMFEVLKERYSKNEAIIERLGAALTLEKDLNAFVAMIGDVYESAYLRAVNDHRDQLTKLGLSARIVPNNQSKEG